jgi:hypothetical protein
MFRSYLYKSSPYLVGVGASVGLLAFYLGLMTLTGDWFYAKIQFEEYRWWIIALSVGLGTQRPLFTFLRRGLKATEKKAAMSTLAVRKHFHRLHGGLLSAPPNGYRAFLGVTHLCSNPSEVSNVVLPHRGGF